MGVLIAGIGRTLWRMVACRRGGAVAATLVLCLAVFPMAADAEDAKAPETFRDCANCPEMVVLPPGQFLMGSTEQDAEREVAAIPVTPLFYRALGWNPRKRAVGFMAYERPQHLVTISAPFAIGRFPVTVEEFGAFVAETGHDTGPCWIPNSGRQKPPVPSAWSKPGFAQTARDPVVCVTWEDARAYARWLNMKVAGGGGPATADRDAPYRLPSEAEWEYAARGGTRTAHWWGDDIRPGFARCNGCDQAPGTDPPDSPRQMTAPVGSYPANPFGLYDMLGNVAQVALDCWHETYVGAPTDGSAWLDGGCVYRTERGSSWRGSPWTVRAAGRERLQLSEGHSDVGFRLVRTLPRASTEKQQDQR